MVKDHDNLPVDWRAGAQVLLDEACRRTGISDFDDIAFVDSLSELLENIASTVTFNETGSEAFQEDLIRYLVNRLRMQADIKSYPDILNENVSDPLVVIGLPRTGTTKIQRMLAAAPNMQRLEMWRMINPARFPDAQIGKPDPRLAAVGLSPLLEGESNQVQTGHAMNFYDVDEDTVLSDFTLDVVVTGFNTQYPVIDFSGWRSPNAQFKTRVDRAYGYVKQLIQYLQWQDGGKRDRPWVLKSVMHIGHLETLLNCYPNAVLIHTHRDPKVALASIAKLMTMVWSLKSEVDKKQVGQWLLEWSGLAIRNYMAERERLNLDSRIIDVSYETVRSDLMPTFKDIYDRAKIPWSDQAEQAMKSWQLENEQHKHGAHHYSLEEFGLCGEQVEKTFAEYQLRYKNYL